MDRPPLDSYAKRRATCTRCIQEFTTRRPEQKRCDFCIKFELQQKRNATGAP